MEDNLVSPCVVGEFSVFQQINCSVKSQASPLQSPQEIPTTAPKLEHGNGIMSYRRLESRKKYNESASKAVVSE